MDIRIETRRWKRLLRLFGGDGAGIEGLTHRLVCALDQTYPSESAPLIQTWADMRAVVETVIEVTKTAEEKP